MASLTYDEILEAAVKILLFVDRGITVHFSKDSIRIRFPTTRKLAEYLKTPHYYVLPYFATMEKEDIITRVERVGISTTKQGSKKLIEIMATKYKEETVSIFGTTLFSEIKKQVMAY
jgi:DNA-binding transcriptional regulator YhcF (GntR family)